MQTLFHGPVLITGGNSALGIALALALRQAGATSVSVCRSAQGLAQCRTAGLPCLLLNSLTQNSLVQNSQPQDDAQQDSPENLPERCKQLLGQEPAYLVDLMHSRFESLIAGATPAAIGNWAADDIGLRARVLRAVACAMLAKRFGRCLFVSSSAAECPAQGQGYYAAAKLAGEAVYRSLACELSGKGVTACSLRLGWLEAGRGHIFLEQHREAAKKRIPTQRIVSVEEAVQSMLFLLSPAAMSINATSISMDGGLGACKGKLQDI